MKPTREEILEKAEELRDRDTSYETDVLEVTNWAIEETLKDCIEIPAWPDDPDVRGIAVVFTTSDYEYFEGYKRLIEYIPRPQQSIKFKVGDPVFWEPHSTEIIFRVTEIDDFDITISSNITATANALKPAKLEDLGKDWSQI